jgi:hypothetical protein
LARSTAITFVDSVETSLGDQTAGVKHFVFIGGNVGRDGIVRVPRFDQFIAQLAARFHQKRAAAHRRVADFQVEDLGGVGRANANRGVVVVRPFLFQPFSRRDFAGG